MKYIYFYNFVIFNVISNVFTKRIVTTRNFHALLKRGGNFTRFLPASVQKSLLFINVARLSHELFNAVLLDPELTGQLFPLSIIYQQIRNAY